MKKLVLCSLLLFNLVLNAQDYKLNDFKTLKNLKTTTDSSYLKQFKETNSWFDLNSIETEVDLHELVNPEEIILVCKMKNITKYNFCYISMNTKNNTFAFFYINKELDKISIYNKSDVLILSSLNDEGKIKLINEIQSRITCFSACMAWVEEQITDDALGWAAWNLSPATQVAAAYGCDKTCRPRLGL